MTEPRPSKSIEELNEYERGWMAGYAARGKLDQPPGYPQGFLEANEAAQHPTTNSGTAHNHTPWPVYKKQLTSSGYSVKHVNEIIEGLEDVWDCPACEALRDIPEPDQLPDSPTPDVSQIPTVYSSGKFPPQPDKGILLPRQIYMSTKPGDVQLDTIIATVNQIISYLRNHSND